MKMLHTCLVASLCVLLTACGDSERQASPAQPLQLDGGCHVDTGCRARAGGLSVQVRFAEQPRPLQPFPVHLSLAGDAEVSEVLVSFSMQGMDMGPNRYRLLSSDGSDWAADITLPVCVSGRSDWVATFELLAEERRWLLEVPFVVSR